jgi:hypothetical protein
VLADLIIGRYIPHLCRLLQPLQLAKYGVASLYYQTPSWSVTSLVSSPRGAERISCLTCTPLCTTALLLDADRLTGLTGTAGCAADPLD